VRTHVVSSWFPGGVSIPAAPRWSAAFPPLPGGKLRDMIATAPTPRIAVSRAARRAALPAVLLGLGLGAFIDGIVLHQLLQWHHVLSDTAENPVGTVAGLEANTLADGVFHAGALIVTAAGALLALRHWRAGLASPPWPVHIGGLITGWGCFNVTEAMANHHLFGVHHVRDDLGGPLSWDLGWLAASVILLVAGLVIARRGWRTAR